MTLSAAIGALIISSAMAGVGNSYTYGEQPDSDCKLQAVWYLKVAGGWGVTMNVLGILINCILCVSGSKDEQDPRGHACGCVEVLGGFVISIWGSVIVFGPYQEWTYQEDNKDSVHYCAYTPYMFAFVMLILNWVLSALRAIVICLCVVRNG